MSAKSKARWIRSSREILNKTGDISDIEILDGMGKTPAEWMEKFRAKFPSEKIRAPGQQYKKLIKRVAKNNPEYITKHYTGPNAKFKHKSYAINRAGLAEGGGGGGGATKKRKRVGTQGLLDGLFPEEPHPKFKSPGNVGRGIDGGSGGNKKKQKGTHHRRDNRDRSLPPSADLGGALLQEGSSVKFVDLNWRKIINKAHGGEKAGLEIGTGLGGGLGAIAGMYTGGALEPATTAASAAAGGAVVSSGTGLFAAVMEFVRQLEDGSKKEVHKDVVETLAKIDKALTPVEEQQVADSFLERTAARFKDVIKARNFHEPDNNHPDVPDPAGPVKDPPGPPVGNPGPWGGFGPHDGGGHIYGDDPEDDGDGHHIPDRPDQSVPGANHSITKSNEAANNALEKDDPLADPKPGDTEFVETGNGPPVPPVPPVPPGTVPPVPPVPPGTVPPGTVPPGTVPPGTGNQQFNVHHIQAPNQPQRDVRTNLTHEQTAPKPGEQLEDLHFRALLPIANDDALVRPVGAVQKHKDEFTLFDFHERDSEFASLGDQMDDDFYKQRLREDAIRFKSPLNAMPLEFKGTNDGLKPGDSRLGGYGTQPRAPEWSFYNHEKFRESPRGMAFLKEQGRNAWMESFADNSNRFAPIADGTYAEFPLAGIMHDQMRENINFGKSDFIQLTPYAPVESTTQLDTIIPSETDLDTYMSVHRNPTNTTDTLGTYAWPLI